MLAALRDKLKDLLKAGWEKFLVIEESEDGFELTRAKVNNKTKKIYISGFHKVANLEDLKKPLFSVDKIVLALSSHKALTIESVVHLKRADPEELISEGELDTLLFRGLWEFLNHYRSWVAKKLKITDLELVLAHAGVREVSIGSYRVFNPLGFKGGELVIRYRGTFISRALIGFIEKLEHWARDFILVEAGEILSLSIPGEIDYFVSVGNKITNIHLIAPEERLYLKNLLWGRGRILKAVGEIFGVDPGLAYELLERSVRGKTSKKIKRLIEEKVKSEIKTLLTLLRSSLSRARRRPTIYFNFRLPPELIAPLLGSRYLRLLNLQRQLEEKGYDVIISEKKENDPQNYQSILALITHIYLPPQYQFLNQLLTRRSRWLIAQS